MTSDLLGSAFLATWLAAGVRLSGPVLLAALGETFAERSGVLNVGIEGTILFGALASYLATYATGSVWAGLLAALLVGVAANVALAWMYVTARASQVVAGIVFNVLALGLASFVYRLALGTSASPRMVPMFPALRIPGLSGLPLVGPVLFSHSILLYGALALVAVAHVVLFRTRFGLALRAAGENPEAAGAAGISVARMRYAGVLISGGAAGLSGAYTILAEVGLFRETIVSGQGFVALALVILGSWSPWKVALGAFLFGAADALQLSLQLLGADLPPQILLSLPYVLTIVAISGVFGRRASQPAALTQPYVRAT